jgi:alpha-galactosidase/6-phospho-beta-glucosidase family protein
LYLKRTVVQTVLSMAVDVLAKTSIFPFLSRNILAVGDLPVAVRGLVQQIKSFERVAAEAAVTGDYYTALVAMTINPLVPSDTIAKQILDEMLEEHKEYLPQFFKQTV